jgi:hypothetical protein
VVSNELEDGSVTADELDGGKALMIETGRVTTEAAGDAVDAAFAIVAVSVALGRLIAARGRQESRYVLARLGVPGHLTAAAGQAVPAARHLLSHRLGPVAHALLPRSVSARVEDASFEHANPSVRR